MSIGTPLHKAKLENKYDAIVIGSGIGSLSTAACLAKAGRKVLVLEQHYTAGGFTHTYSRKGYEWDVGVHYIGDVHREGSVLRKVFDYISDSKLKWAQMEDNFDRIYLGNESYDYVSGVKSFRDKMVAYFPDEEAAIDKYISLVRQVNRYSSLYYMQKVLPTWLGQILYKKLTGPYIKYAAKTTDEVLKSITKNEKLIAVLTGQWGDYGLPPKKSSFAMHALVTKHYFNGASYPVGGSSEIARTIEAVIAGAGGQIVVNAKVSDIMISGNKARGIRLHNGTEVFAEKIVSGAGVINTYGKLLPDSVKQKYQLEEKLKKTTPSIAHLALYIGLNGTTKELGLKTTNLWIYPDHNHDENLSKFLNFQSEDLPVVYISFPSAKDPEWEKKYPNKSTIEIIAPVSYEWFKKWEGTKWQKRGEDYNSYKKEMTQVLLNYLFQKHPNLKDKVAFAELSTPLSTAHFSGHDKGQIYGIDHTPGRFQEKWLRASTPIKNLYLTGQDIVTCGVGGALCAGILTSIAVLGPLAGLNLIKLMSPTRSKAQAKA